MAEGGLGIMTGSDGDEEAFASLVGLCNFEAEDVEHNGPAPGGAPEIDEQHHPSLPPSRPRGGEGGASWFGTQPDISAAGAFLLDHPPSTVLL